MLWTFFCYVLHVFSSIYWRCHQATLPRHQSQFLSSSYHLLSLLLPNLSYLFLPVIFLSYHWLSIPVLYNLFACSLHTYYVSNILFCLSSNSFHLIFLPFSFTKCLFPDFVISLSCFFQLTLSVTFLSVFPLTLSFIHLLICLPLSLLSVYFYSIIPYSCSLHNWVYL